MVRLGQRRRRHKIYLTIMLKLKGRVFLLNPVVELTKFSYCCYKSYKNRQMLLTAKLPPSS